jgi:DHA1 family tetracycline resistance protein-like MFS transporter
VVASGVLVKLLPILGITFIDILGFSILIPLLPYFVKHFGAPDVVVGALFGVFAFCQFIAGPVWGNVSDRIGRKRVLIVSQIGATIGWTMLAFAPTIAWVFVARIIEGFSGGNLSVTQAYVSDLVEPDKRARAFGYVGAAFSAGLIFGPASGGYLVQHFGFTMPFLLAAGLQVVTLVLTILVLPESRSVDPDAAPASLRDIPRAFTIAGVAPVMWQKLIFALGIYGWFGAFTLVLQKQFGFNATATSYFFCTFGVASVIAQLAAVGTITERTGDRRSAPIGYVLLMIAFAIVPFATAIWQAVVMIGCFSLGMSLVNASLPSQLSRLAPEAMRGTVLGAAASMESIAGIFMPLATTYALQAGGVLPAAAIPFAFTGFALVLGVVTILRSPTLVPAAKGSA